MYKSWVIFIILFSVSKLSYTSQTDYRIGYYGNYFINPGISGGISYTLTSYNSKALFSKRKTKKEILLSTQAGVYWDPFSHSGFFVQGNLTYLHETKMSNIKRYSSLGIGVLRTVLPETYTYNSNGDLIKKNLPLPGYAYIYPSITIFGHESKLNNANSLYFHPTFNFLLNYNGFILPSFILELGVKF